jgi:hypothetical protein|tara:strand:- start:1572 stop:2465 length:894 start_codon:yes stop_codon:yes gene_type:complete
MKKIVDIADLDCVYLSYDEPKKEEFWIKISNMVPWATRIDGVKGSDAAHKAAADASTTDRFILIDGDNIPKSEFFNQQLVLDDDNQDCVFRWKARNEINGLMYGNGGLSCWTKQFIYNMKTHENSDGSDDTAVEFCFDPNYWAMHDCYSTTYPNATPFQAWRAGFREGVKMCLDRGTKPSISDFKQKAHNRNLDHLAIWHNVGRDVENGQWSMLGARLGTKMTMLGDWDYTEVQWFDNLEKKWNTIKDQNPEPLLAQYANSLRRLDLDIVELDLEQSTFFKKHYKSGFKNQGVMVRE